MGILIYGQNEPMIVISIIAAIAILYLLWIKYIAKNERSELSKILKAHHELGYPLLSNEVQFTIIENNDLSPIASLIPSYDKKAVPFYLLQKYITVSFEEFVNHLSITKADKRYQIENAPTPEYDGIWVKENNVFIQERGVIEKTWLFNDNEEVLPILAKHFWSFTELRAYNIK